ncbi:MAG TPA: hypothetical protein VNN55_07575 [bacterium]|nr:hypothetical protein [bacterium]
MHPRLPIFAGLLVLFLATVSAAQTVPDTQFCGTGPINSRFSVSETVDSARVAIRLPDALAGTLITSIRAYYLQGQPDTTSAATWAAHAAFAWALHTGNVDQPGPVADIPTAVSLSANPNLRIGGWVESPVNWQIHSGPTYWLVGYWQQNAAFVRLGANQYNPDLTTMIGYADGGSDVWIGHAVGLMVEIHYLRPDQGPPSGIFDDPASEPAGERAVASARLEGPQLVVSLADASAPYTFSVVNILGQTLVSGSGAAPTGEIRLPWSIHRPSSVYYCRIVAGGVVTTIPLVHLK